MALTTRQYTLRLLVSVFLIGIFILSFFPELIPPKSLVGGLSDDSDDMINTVPEPLPKKPYKILFLGDMIFDRGVQTNIRKKGEDFVFASSTIALSNQYDITIGNLEGPITNFTSKTIDARGVAIPGFTFTFPTSTASLLKRSGLDIVSLANNHSNNFGTEGLRQSIEWLSKAGIGYFGNPSNQDLDVSPSTYTLCPELYTPKCIALIGYNQFAYGHDEDILAQIKSIKDQMSTSSISSIIVFAHWGEEYQKTPTKFQSAQARSWIEAGANLIIGAHPHIVQTIERYKDTYIFYSLGNYIFDQYFSYDTTHGITVGITYDPDLTKIIDIQIIPIDNTGTFVRLADQPNSNKILDELKLISPTVPELFDRPSINDQ